PPGARRPDRPPARRVRSRPHALREHGMGTATGAGTACDGARPAPGRPGCRAQCRARRSPARRRPRPRRLRVERCGGARRAPVRRGRVARLATAGRRAHRRASARLRLGQRVPRAARWAGRAAVPHPALPVGPRRGRGGAVGRGPPRAGAPSEARPQNGGRVSSLTPRRLPIVLTIVALLAAGGLADRAGRPAPAGAREQSPFAMPVAAPTSALSSTWYCAGGTSQLKGFADGWLVLANSEDRTVP